MRISDWSSDVCSSDLLHRGPQAKDGLPGFSGMPAIRRPARPVGLRGEIKGEASAAGGRRRTFAPKVCRSRRASQVTTRDQIGSKSLLDFAIEADKALQQTPGSIDRTVQTMVPHTRPTTTTITHPNDTQK